MPWKDGFHSNRRDPNGWKKESPTITFLFDVSCPSLPFKDLHPCAWCGGICAHQYHQSRLLKLGGYFSLDHYRSCFVAVLARLDLDYKQLCSKTKTFVCAINKSNDINEQLGIEKYLRTNCCNHRATAISERRKNSLIPLWDTLSPK